MARFPNGLGFPFGGNSPIGTRFRFGEMPLGGKSVVGRSSSRQDPKHAWRNKTSWSFGVWRSSPSRRAMFRSAESGPFDTVFSRQQTTLQPNPTDRKPTLEAERQGLGCSEPGTFRPFRPRRFRRQHSKFRTFFGNFKPFRHFFSHFFAIGRNFSPDGWIARRFCGRGLQAFLASACRLAETAGRGTDRPCEACPSRSGSIADGGTRGADRCREPHGVDELWGEDCSP